MTITTPCDPTPLFVRQPSGRYRPADQREVLDTAAAYCKPVPRTKIADPATTRRFLRAWLGKRAREHFIAMWLDNRHRVIECEALWSGTIDGASVYPREVVKRALQLGAAAVIFAHNHPSGVSEPSDADRRMTRRLRDALALVDIRVLDHIVIGDDESASFAERGWL